MPYCHKRRTWSSDRLRSLAAAKGYWTYCRIGRTRREFALAQQGDSSVCSLLIRLLCKPESVDLDRGHFIVKRRVLHLQEAKRGRRFKLAVPCAWYRSALAACD